MPPPPPEVFLEAVVSTVRANSHYVPPQGKGSLYIRPLLLGTGPILGLGPAPSYTLVVYAAAVGAYFKVSSYEFIGVALRQCLLTVGGGFPGGFSAPL